MIDVSHFSFSPDIRLPKAKTVGTIQTKNTEIETHSHSHSDSCWKVQTILFPSAVPTNRRMTCSMMEMKAITGQKGMYNNKISVYLSCASAPDHQK